MDFKESLQEAKERLVEYKRPFILYDDDPDGLSAFLILYRYLKEGKHMPVKSSPKVTDMFLPKIEEYDPDVLIILDKPLIDEDFLHQLKVPVLWFDHHTKEKIKDSKLKEYNPRDFNMTQCSTAQIMYEMLETDKWIAGIGSIADWTKPAFIDELKKEYPSLITKDTVEDILFASPWGSIIKRMSLILKLPTNKYQRMVKKMLTMQSPTEFLTQEFAEEVIDIEEQYEELLARAKKSKEEGNIRVFIYPAGKNSFTKELSNEMMYLHPEKTIIIGRNKDQEIKMSIRSPLALPGALKEALEGLRGYGGGHEHACGGQVHSEDFVTFKERLSYLLK